MARPTGTTPRKRRIVHPGKEEFQAIWPFALIAALWVFTIYGIIIYESLFQLPALAPVK